MSRTNGGADVRYLYIGPDDCKKATCNRRQEFPNADDPYCFEHSAEGFFGGNSA